MHPATDRKPTGEPPSVDHRLTLDVGSESDLRRNIRPLLLWTNNDRTLTGLSRNEWPTRVGASRDPPRSSTVCMQLACPLAKRHTNRSAGGVRTSAIAAAIATSPHPGIDDTWTPISNTRPALGDQLGRALGHRHASCNLQGKSTVAGSDAMR